MRTIPGNTLRLVRDARGQIFNGDGLVVSYRINVRATKETTMKLTVVASRSAFFDHNKWIRYSHWGMFQVRGKSSNLRSET